MMRQALLAVAIALAITAQLRAHTDFHDATAWAGLALAAGLALLAGVPRGEPQLPVPQSALGRPRRSFGIAALAAVAAATILGSIGTLPIVGLLLWVASVPLGVLAVRDWQITPPRSAAAPWSRGEIAALLALLVCAGLARALWLDVLPRSIFGDEPRVAVYIRQAFVPRLTLQSFFIMGWNTWPAIGLALQGLFVPLLGLDITALRASSALMGTLGVLTAYVLARELFDTRPALCAAILLAGGRTAIDFSRLGIAHAQILFLEPLALFHLWRAFHGGRAVHWLMAGVVAGWCLYSYNAGQLVAPLLLAWIALVALRHGALRRTHWRGVALLVGALLLTVLPYAYAVSDGFHFGANWSEWTVMARSRQTLGHMIDAWRAGGAAPAWSILRDQLWITWLGFGVLPGSYGLGYRRGGMLDDVSAALFVVGLGIALRRIGRGNAGFVLFWLVLTIFAGGIATVDPPAFVRMIGLLPALTILAALPLDALMAAAGPVAWRRVVAGLASAGLLAGALWINWQTYFGERTAVLADPSSELVRYLAAQPGDTHADLVGGEYFLAFGQELFDIELPGRGRDLSEPAHLLPLHEPSAALTLILGPTQMTLLPYIQQLYPHATFTDVIAANEPRPFFRAVHIPPDEARERSGLLLRGAAPLATDDAHLPRDPFAASAGGAAATSSSWSGSVYWPTSHPVEVHVTAARQTRLTIGAAPAIELAAGETQAVTLTLPRGWQPIGLDERGAGAGALQIAIGGMPLTRWQLRPESGEGLRATYRQADGSVVESIDPQLNSFVIEGLGDPRDAPVAHMPFTAAWRGTLRVDVTGEYRFDAIGSGPYRISLDGQPLLDAPDVVAEEPIATQQQRTLQAGPHHIEAVFDSSKPAHTGRRILQLYWTPPGGERALIPPSQFRLD